MKRGGRQPMITPEARARLAGLMDKRRLELRLTWREVAEAGGVSYEALRATRNGKGDIRPLTQAGIEKAFRWEQGSITRILNGGGPVPLEQPAHSLPSADRAPVIPRSPEDSFRPLVEAPEAQKVIGPFLADVEDRVAAVLDARLAADLDAFSRGVIPPARPLIPSGAEVFGQPGEEQWAEEWDVHAAQVKSGTGRRYTLDDLVVALAIRRYQEHARRQGQPGQAQAG